MAVVKSMGVYGNMRFSDECKVTIEQDGKYFRVVLKYDTHKLHSEKLNLETAFALAYKFEVFFR